MLKRNCFSHFILFGAMMLLNSQFVVAQDQSFQLQPVEKHGYRPTLLVLKPLPGNSTVNPQDIQEMYDLFVFDLQFADAFDVFEENPQAQYIKQQDEANNTVDYTSWKNLRVKDRQMDYVVKSKLVAHGTRQYELQILVYNTQENTREMGRAYGAPPHSPFTREQFRRAGHTATGDIITQLSEVEPITLSKICFVNSNQTKNLQEIYAIDYDGHESSIKQLTFFNSTSILPAWSPDGNEIAYVSFRNEWADVFLQNVQTGEVNTLAKFRGTNTNPRWFPNGQKLILSLSVPGNFEIHTIPKTGSKRPERLTNHEAKDFSPDVSPRGNEIVFSSDRNSTIPQIHKMNVDGSNVQRISFIKRQCDQAKWSPVPIEYSFGSTARNDHRIAFTGFFAGGQSDIWTMWPDGTDAQQLTDNGRTNESPSWSPDAKYLVFSSDMLGNGKSDLFLMSSQPGSLLPNGKRFHRLTYLSGNNLNPDWSNN